MAFLIAQTARSSRDLAAVYQGNRSRLPDSAIAKVSRVIDRQPERQGTQPGYFRSARQYTAGLGACKSSFRIEQVRARTRCPEPPVCLSLAFRVSGASGIICAMPSLKAVSAPEYHP